MHFVGIFRSCYSHMRKAVKKNRYKCVQKEVTQRESNVWVLQLASLSEACLHTHFTQCTHRYHKTWLFLVHWDCMSWIADLIWVCIYIYSIMSKSIMEFKNFVCCQLTTLTHSAISTCYICEPFSIMEHVDTAVISISLNSCHQSWECPLR